ncbi:MAG TPA: cytochrome c [Methylomirabilota bacterium]|jgi:mono/diheme cytochrome c family protein|nr:cytochrome c [Methylomirabilota bacterium]
MMKYAFLLVLLIIGGVASLLAFNVVYRWTHNMFHTQRVMSGEMSFSMPAGSVARSGSELYYPKEAREAAAARKNPVPPSPESVKKGGELFAIYCTPCHGAAGKGDGLVATKFVQPADLSNPDLHKVRTDGYWQSYLGAGGAVMPSYGEALSPEERWHIVNFMRTLAKR